MRRIWLIAGVAGILMVGLFWLAEDERFRQTVLDYVPQAADDPPSWGDVANKVGEFAQEEQDLKTAIGGVQSGADRAR